ncbi:hypothetical protein V490_06979 [Pseudogymnoascus sp. VKM F-3557]|nr:hypothetical protein V490_06979 [Pseudogymnoascus sp. VKM F-3557]
MAPVKVIKNVAIAGAGGNLGPSVLKVLLASNLFTITILTRPSSKHEFPSNVTVIPVDYNSPASLASALAGQDAVVSFFGSESIPEQAPLLEAAIAAGVTRFIPSDFGSDTHNELVKGLAVYAGKIEIQDAVAERAARGLIEYTQIITGPFLDWGFTNGVLADLGKKSVKLVDGGDRPISGTTREHIGTAVLGVLTHLEETKNRTVYVKNYDATQNEAVEIGKKLVGEEGWVVTNVKSADLEADAWADLKAQKFDGPVWLNFIYRAIFGDGYGGQFEGKDNALLGVPTFGREDFEKTLKGALLGGFEKAIPGSILGAVTEQAASERLRCRTNKLDAVTEQAAAERLICRANKLGAVPEHAAHDQGAARSEKAAGEQACRK